MKLHLVNDWRMPAVDLGSLPIWLDLCRSSSHQFRKMKGQWEGETVVCVGNGPSINQTDLRCLDGAKVIGTNRAYMLLDQFSPSEFCLAIQDNQRMVELESDLQRLSCTLLFGNLYFTPDSVPAEWMLAGRANQFCYLPYVDWVHDEGVIRPVANFSPGFSSDPTKYVHYGYSIIFSAIQFAAYFGAKRIVCIGIDMDFSQGNSFSKDVKNIFEPFRYEQHAKPNFELMHAHLASVGVELVNATPGGAVDALPRMTLKDAI
ncbi:motility associated factor glycosyltransferase family protein [Rubripirellula lacrimiformis]|uniref:hypothetical protein n=1 Tax=Rubripirellula lacrimiformis TaxID=1930273 RepID=UPI0011A1B686|nr:hypothetical protein [Rubripirellula lacrimiformis]